MEVLGSVGADSVIFILVDKSVAVNTMEQI
jgi:hypothetical protein